MKKLILIIVSCIAIIFPGHAAVINKQDAINIAYQVAAFSNQSRSGTNIKLLWDSENLVPSPSRNIDNPAFYVFELTAGKGFVIVAGDDSVNPVLGYSFDSAMPQPDNLPVNFKAWMANIREGIMQYRSKNPSRGTASYTESRATIQGIGKEVVMLKTAKWNQGDPYNRQTPKDGNINCVVGCTNTAIAIMMKYYNWPKQGIGQTEEYVTRTRGIKVPSRNLEKPYDWDNMKLEYSSIKGYTEKEADAVARLMADIGAVMQAEYTADETCTSCYPSDMIKKFDYHPNLKRMSRNYNENGEWVEYLKNELNSERPILYEAGSWGDDGHMFVLDGYTTKNYFHVNWGWGGYCDGFFELNKMIPTEGYNYSSSQVAYINFVPNDGRFMGDEIIFVDSGMHASTEDIYPYEKVDVEVNLINEYSRPIAGKICLVVTDERGRILDYLSEEMDVTLEPDVKFNHTFNVMLNNGIAYGQRIRLQFKKTEEDKWHTIKSLDNSNIPWEIKLGNVDISDLISVNYHDYLLTISYKENMTVEFFQNGKQLQDDITITDNSTSIFLFNNYSSEPVIVRVSKGNEVKEFTFQIKKSLK